MSSSRPTNRSTRKSRVDRNGVENNNHHASVILSLRRQLVDEQYKHRLNFDAKSNFANFATLGKARGGTRVLRKKLLRLQSASYNPTVDF